MSKSPFAKSNNVLRYNSEIQTIKTVCERGSGGLKRIARPMLLAHTQTRKTSETF